MTEAPEVLRRRAEQLRAQAAGLLDDADALAVKAEIVAVLDAAQAELPPAAEAWQAAQDAARDAQRALAAAERDLDRVRTRAGAHREALKSGDVEVRAGARVMLAEYEAEEGMVTGRVTAARATLDQALAAVADTEQALHLAMEKALVLARALADPLGSEVGQASAADVARVVRNWPGLLLGHAAGTPLSEHDLAIVRAALWHVLTGSGELPRLRRFIVDQTDAERAAQAYLDRAADAAAAVRRERGLSEPDIAVPAVMPVTELTLQTAAGPVRVEERSVYGQPGVAHFETYSPVLPPHRPGGAP